MRRKLISARALIRVKDLDGRQVLTVNRKIAALRSTYDVKDRYGNLLGRTKKAILTLFHPRMWMEDARRTKILEAKCSFAGWNFTIRDKNGRGLAEVHKSDWWRDVFLRGPFDFSDTYALHIRDKSYDRRILLGFVIAIDNSVHDRPGISIRGFGIRPPVMID